MSICLCKYSIYLINWPEKIPSQTVLDTIQNMFRNPSVMYAFIKITYNNTILEISLEIQEFATS